MGSKAAAVNFLKKLNFDASDSSDSSSSSDEEQAKQQLVKKRRRPDSEDSGMEDKQPARRAPRKKKPVSDDEEEEKPARAVRKKKPDVKDADGEEDAEMEKKKEKLAKRRIRDKARRDRVAEERRQLQVEDSDKMQEKEQDKLQEKEEEALTKKKEVAPKEREEKQLSRKAREDKSATKRKTKEEKDAPRKKKEEVDEDAQRKDDEHKPTVTPSPSRKRARVSSSSSLASIGSNASSVVLTEDQKAKKALRKYRMDKLRNRREIQLEKKQAQRELHRALDKRDALLARKQAEKGAQDTVKKEKRKGKDAGRENNDVDKMPKSRPLKKRRRTEDDADVIKNEPNQVTPSADEAGKAHYTDKETDNTKDESPMSTSNDADSEPPLHNESAKEENIEDAAKPPSPKDDPEDGEIHEEPPPPKEEKEVDKDNADESVTNVKAENDGAGKVKDEPAVLADMPIPKKSSSNSNALADLPIPRKARNPGEDPASFVIPKRPMSAAAAGGNADGAEGAVHLSTSRMVRKPRAPLPDILKAVVNAAPSALVRPSRPRTKQVVPSELTKLDQAEKTFVITARKRRSLICASLSSEEFSRGPTPYEVFNADGSLMPDLTPRLMCPTLRDLSTNRDEYPSTYFGVGLASPKVKVKTDREDSADKSVSSVAVPGPLNCYEPLQFLRPEDRDSYQRKMYGTTFVPQLIKGHTTLIMRNAKYERKSRGIRFNADRDREDFQQVLSQRFKKNKSTPVCEIPRESWRKMMVDQRPGIVYLHFYNREDAMLAALEFVDDMGVPLEWKREYRAGIVLTANVNSTTPQSAPERSPSSERSFAPAASPNDSQYGSDRDRGRQSHRGRGRNWNGDQRGPPHRLQSHYGEQQVMHRSPAEPGDRGQRPSYMTPTGRNDRGREFDRPQHPSHSRSRSNPRSPSRSRSIHNPAADAPVDEKTASFPVNGDMSKQNGEESKGDALRPSQDNAKTVGGGDNGSIDSIKASDSNQGSHEGSVPTNMPSKDHDVYASSNQRHGAQTYPSNHDGRGGSHYGEYNSGSNNHDQWRGNDGRQRFGRRSRSRSRPRNQEPRRDWGRDDRGPHPPPDYDRRHSNGMYHDDGRGRGGYGGNDRYGPPPPPPPLPGDAPYHHDRRRY